MAVDKDTVARIAKLARIRIPEEQQEALTGELTEILNWVEQLSELDTEGVEPMTSVVSMSLAAARGRGDRRRITPDKVTEKRARESAHMASTPYRRWWSDERADFILALPSARVSA